MKNPLVKQTQKNLTNKQTAAKKVELEVEDGGAQIISKSNPKTSRFKILAANIVNVALIAACIFLLNRFEPTAQKIKELRSQNIAAQESSDIAVLQADLERNASQINELKSVFLDDEGFIVFISQIDALKLEGTISEFVFPGGQPVRDKTNNVGFPVAIQFRGSAAQVDAAFQKVQMLPYIIKPLSIELSVQSAEDIVLQYSAFLIVDESFFTN